MHTFLENFHQGGKYSAQIASHQEELRIEEKFTDQKSLNISSLQTDYLNLYRSSGVGRNSAYAYHQITAPFRALSWWAFIYFWIIFNKPCTKVAPTKNENPRAKKNTSPTGGKTKMPTVIPEDFFSRKLRRHFHGKERVPMKIFVSKLCMYSHYQLSG